MTRLLKREAVRYSGEVRIYLAFDDKNNEWQASVNTRDGRRVIYVGAANWLKSGHAVDTPEAWDTAALSALAFSSLDDEELGQDENINTSQQMAYDDVGNPYVGRTFNKAWPPNSWRAK